MRAASLQVAAMRPEDIMSDTPSEHAKEQIRRKIKKYMTNDEKFDDLVVSMFLSFLVYLIYNFASFAWPVLTVLLICRSALKLSVLYFSEAALVCTLRSSSVASS